MLAPLLKTLVSLVIIRGLWQIYQKRAAKSSLNNIPGPPAASILTGSFGDLFNLNGWDFHASIAKKYGGIVKIKGILGENRLYVFDPTALHYILVKEQHIFEESPFVITMNKLMFGEGVGAVQGEQHRKQRKILNPVFSIAHMREMLLTFYDVSSKLRDVISDKVKDGPQEIEILDWMTRTALELIGRSGLGYSFDSFEDQSHQHPYCDAAKQLMPTLFTIIAAANFVAAPFSKIGSPWFRRKVVDLIPSRRLHKLRDIIDTLYSTSITIFESKRKALEEGGDALEKEAGRGKDIMTVLMKANMNASKEESMTREELLGQMTILIFAAMDTTSNALSRILYLLSKNQHVQDKLRNEIKEATAGGAVLSYDELVSLPYLDAICRETLRLYPPVSMVERIAEQDTVIPLSSAIKGCDGTEIRELHIPKGTGIHIGILASNRNVEIWGPDANEWKPERWLGDLPDSVIAAHLPGVYSHLLTFIGGRRACIGFKFSQLEMKAVLLNLIETFRFSPTKHEICWQMGPITTPAVLGKEAIPQLPLLVEKLPQ